MKNQFLLTFALLGSTWSIGIAQNTPKATPVNPMYNWFNLDLQKDGVMGVSTEKTYTELLSGRTPVKVRVAVIDGGVDSAHEDLVSALWTNPKEIAGNGKDDDGNGYVDDVHGWNFIGGKDKKDVGKDTYEATRIFASLDPIFSKKPKTTWSKAERAKYPLYLKAKADYQSQLKKNQDQLDYLTKIYTMASSANESVKKVLNGKKVDSVTLKNLKSTDPDVTRSAEFLGRMLQFGIKDIDAGVAELKEGVDHYQDAVSFGLNTSFNPRNIVGDNYLNPNERYYGNHDVTGPDALHGTHVSGIIGANRDNNLGIKGVSNSVEIMAVRTVPDGDERDKDVANAVRYAADNGASIINMSFGKGFSPFKKTVDEAMEYAEKKGVLLIHSAGNESSNNDSITVFPNKKCLDGHIISSWIEIGASTKDTGAALVASFSNYGKNTVDVFSPGVDIYSTVPGNKYKNESGTSMASPVVTGIAAVLKSYFPKLTATQLKEIILQSSIKVHANVVSPSKDGSATAKVPFESLSTSGGVVNLYQAVKMAIAKFP